MTATDLNQELAELRSAADAYAARHQFIPDLTWPEGVRIAVNFTCDFDAMLLRRLLNEPPMQLAKGEFGGRVGIWRLVELFDAHGVKATIFTPGRISELYPQALRAVVQSSHEIADHMWEHRVPKEPALEEDHLAKTVAALETSCGPPPGRHAQQPWCQAAPAIRVYLQSGAVPVFLISLKAGGRGLNSHRGRYGNPLRPVVEPGGRAPGDRPSPPDRPNKACFCL